MPGGGLEALGGDLGKKKVQEAVLADLGRFGTGAGCPKWQQDGRTWRQDGAKMAQDGACLAILRPTGELPWAFWGVLGAIFAQMAEV